MFTTVRQIQIQIFILEVINQLTIESSILKVSLNLSEFQRIDRNEFNIGTGSDSTGHNHFHHPSNSGGGGTKTTGASGVVG